MARSKSKEISMTATIYNQTKHLAASLVLFATATVIPASPAYAASQHGMEQGHSQQVKQEKDSDDSQKSHEMPVYQKSEDEKSEDTHISNQQHSKSDEHKSANAAPTTEHAKGNNGTLKIHEAGTPDGTEKNDPKVCKFNVEGFGFDAGQSGYVKFDVQGGDKPTGVAQGPFAVGAANASGYFASQYFTLANGHYKANLYGKMLPGGQLSDVKAKSKVFKVSCETKSPVVGGQGSGEVKAPKTDTKGQVLGASTTAATLANTGDSTWVLELIGFVTMASAVALTFLTKSARVRM
jgi:hypothetical protein